METDYDMIMMDLNIHLIEALTDKPSPEVKKSLNRAKFFSRELKRDLLKNIDTAMNIARGMKGKK